MSSKKHLVLFIEEIAANARSAFVQQRLERWTLRKSHSCLGRRANSVLAIDQMPNYKNWFDEITDFYQRFDSPVRFQISDASPAELDPMLAELDYWIDARTSVQINKAESILKQIELNSDYEIFIFDHLMEQWLDAYVHIENISAEKKPHHKRLLSMVGVRTGYLLLQLENQPIAVGRAVAERGWAGIFGVATARDYRRKGIGMQVMRALTEWSLQCNVENLYLQVMIDNKPAMNLYEKLGFEIIYHYYYRTEKY